MAWTEDILREQKNIWQHSTYTTRQKEEIGSIIAELYRVVIFFHKG